MKPSISILVWACVAWLCVNYGPTLTFGVGVGDTKSEFIAEFGFPEISTVRSGNGVLIYFGDEVIIRDGRVVEVPPGLAGRVAQKRFERKNASLNRDRSSSLNRLGRKSKHSVSSTPPQSSGTSHSLSTQIVSNGGAEVELSSYLVPGKVTVVDFYADWCGPCKAIAPQLETISLEDDRVNLVKINIVRWGSPVAKQYRVKSVPSIRVFNGKGKEIGTATHQIRDVVRNINMAL